MRTKRGACNNQRLAITVVFSIRFLRSAGCVVFEILCGYHPFRGTSDLETVFNVLEYRVNIPEGLPDDEADLLRGLLNPIPEERLGVHDVAELRNHFLFAGVDLDSIPYLTDRPSLSE